jgi:hypothetical protein
MDRRMKWRIPRITILRLMVLVAVVGLGLGAEGFRRRLSTLSSQYHAKAAMCRMYAELYDTNANMEEAERKLLKAFPDLEERPGLLMDAGSIERQRRAYVHYRALAEKYDHAAQYPWLTVSSDPPEPK